MKFPLLEASSKFPHFLSLSYVYFILLSNLILFLTCCYSNGYFECYFGLVPHTQPLLFITRWILSFALKATSWAATAFLSHDSLLQKLQEFFFIKTLYQNRISNTVLAFHSCHMVHKSHRFVARFTVITFSFDQLSGLWGHCCIQTYFNHHIYIYEPWTLKKAKEAAINNYSL